MTSSQNLTKLELMIEGTSLIMLSESRPNPTTLRLPSDCVILIGNA